LIEILSATPKHGNLKLPAQVPLKTVTTSHCCRYLKHRFQVKIYPQ